MFVTFVHMIMALLASISLVAGRAHVLVTPSRPPTPTTQAAPKPPKIRCTNAAMAAGECGTAQEQAQARSELAAPGSPEANQNQEPPASAMPPSNPGVNCASPYNQNGSIYQNPTCNTNPNGANAGP